jgi:hypothetical protein
LRKDLSNLRVLGEIPPIKFIPGKNSSAKLLFRMAQLFAFVLDKTLGHGAVLDQLLVNAEMSDELPEEIEREVVLPPMKNNVFGLDRDLIMSKVSTTFTEY